MQSMLAALSNKQRKQILQWNETLDSRCLQCAERHMVAGVVFKRASEIGVKRVRYDFLLMWYGVLRLR